MGRRTLIIVVALLWSSFATIYLAWSVNRVSRELNEDPTIYFHRGFPYPDEMILRYTFGNDLGFVTMYYVQLDDTRTDLIVAASISTTVSLGLLAYLILLRRQRPQSQSPTVHDPSAR